MQPDKLTIVHKTMSLKHTESMDIEFQVFTIWLLHPQGKSPRWTRRTLVCRDAINRWVKWKRLWILQGWVHQKAILVQCAWVRYDSATCWTQR